LGEEGAAYSVAIALTLPLYITLLTVWIQATLLLMAQLGMFYAAFAGARAASVWDGTDVSEKTSNAQIRSAVRNAATPFVSGDARWTPSPATVSPLALAQAEAFASVYDEYLKSPAIPTEHLRSKRLHAQSSVEVGIDRHRAAGADSVTVHVEYAIPIALPVAGWFLGDEVRAPDGDAAYVRTLEASVTLATENSASSPSTSITRKKRMGIRYDEIH
jgi:hypothetical protein